MKTWLLLASAVVLVIYFRLLAFSGVKFPLCLLYVKDSIRTLINPFTYNVPSVLGVINKFLGLTAIGLIISVSFTPRGTVLIMRSSRVLQVLRKKSSEFAS